MTLENGKNPTLDKLARALLASSCLAGAAGLASASTIIEGVLPAPATFPTTGPGYLLPVGTTDVQGTTPGFGNESWFEFQGLLPNSTFMFRPDCCEAPANYTVFNTSSVVLTGDNFENCCTISGSVPGNGDLVVEIVGEGAAGVAYGLSLSAPLGSPEPSTLSAVGLALIGALAWQRRRKRAG